MSPCNVLSSHLQILAVSLSKTEKGEGSRPIHFCSDCLGQGLANFYKGLDSKYFLALWAIWPRLQMLNPANECKSSHRQLPMKQVIGP